MKGQHVSKYNVRKFIKCFLRMKTCIFLFIFLWCSVLMIETGNAYPVKLGDINATQKAIASHYSFHPRSMCFFLHENGLLSAYDLANGGLIWTTDTHSSAVGTKFDAMPSSNTILNDPFALPFIVKGDRLFTRIPNSYEDISSSFMPTRDGSSDMPTGMPYNADAKVPKRVLRSGSPLDGDDAAPHFFMNISTLMRRSPIMVNGADIYVTTSITIADIDAHTGDYFLISSSDPSSANGVFSSAQEAFSRPENGIYSKQSSMPHEEQIVRDGKTTEKGKPSNATTKLPLPLNPFLPMLHMVRYNIHIHAYKLGAYKWSMTLTQVRLSERSLSQVTTNSLEEHTPRFFSHVLRDMLQSDDQLGASCRDTHPMEGKEPFPSPVKPTSGRPTNAAPHAGPPFVSEDGVDQRPHQVVFREVNATHIALWRVRDRLDVWQAAIGPNDPPITIDQTEGERKTLSPPAGTGHRVVSAHVWVGGQHEIARAAVWQSCEQNATPRSSAWLTLPPVLPEEAHGQCLLDQPLLPVVAHNPNGGISSELYLEWGDDVNAETIEGEDLENYYNRKRAWYNDIIFLLSSKGILSETSEKTSSGMVIWVTWRMLVALSVHIACFVCSVGFFCAGVLPRGRLQRAWAQADRNRSVAPVSHPPSVRLTARDLVPLPSLIDTISDDALSINDLSLQSSSKAVTRRFLALPRSIDFVDNSLSDETSSYSSPVLSKNNNGTTEDDTKSSGKSLLPNLKHSDNLDSYEEGNTSSSSSSSSNDELAELQVYLEKARIRASSFKKTLNHPISESAGDSMADHLHPNNKDDNSSSLEGRLFQEHFNVLEKIGHGAEGSVFRVEHRWTHSMYAIKAIQVDAQGQDRVVREAVLHSSFDHHNVVRFFFCWIEDVPLTIANELQLLDHDDGMDTISITNSDGQSAQSTLDDPSTPFGGAMLSQTYRMLFIQMEYFPRGTLADVLRSRRSFQRLVNLRYMKNIAEGLSYLHNTQNVVHRDLKPTNIFVSKDEVLKIGDFGLAMRRDPLANGAAGSPTNLSVNGISTNCENSVAGGSPLYCSPEQMRGDAVNKPSDVFSLGIIAVEMYFVFNTQHERIQVLTKARQCTLPDELIVKYPEEAKLFAEMLKENPSSRPPIWKVIKALKKIIYDVEEDNNMYDGDLITADMSLVYPDTLNSRNGIVEA